MANPDRAAFHLGINAYVPKMAYASNVKLNGPSPFSLGTPAAPDNDVVDTDVDADATAGTETVQTWTADSPYGRTLTMNANADPGAGGIVDLHGKDYLGQPMVERFTFVSGSTAVLYGKKAFYSLEKAVIVGAAANATTYDIGTGYRLGLPYKGDVQWAKENGVFVPVYSRDIYLDEAVFNAVDAAAGSSRFILAPFPGFIKSVWGTHHVAGSTNDPVITVELGGVAVTGLTITLDVSGTAGTVATDAPTTAGYNANNRFRAGDRIEIVGAAAASADEYTVKVEATPTQFSLPVTTDPQTTTTGDPRGTYESLTDMDGVKEIIIGLIGDNSYNSDGNGGLHGIRHVVA